MKAQIGFGTIPLLVGILVITGLVGGMYYYFGTRNPAVVIPSPTPVVNFQTPQPTSSSSLINDPTYWMHDSHQGYRTGGGFYLAFPSSLGYQIETHETHEAQNEVVWKSYSVAGSHTNGSMILRWQNTPFKDLLVNSFLAVYNKGDDQLKAILVVITEINENKTVTLNNKTANRYTISCGVDCYYHIVRFQHTGQYYELIADGAGGGLLQRFDQILSTVEFTKSTIGF